MLKYRLIFGPLLIALLVGVLYADHWMAGKGLPKGLAMLALAMVAVAAAALEFARFMKAKGWPVGPKQVVAAALLGLVGMPASIWLPDMLAGQAFWQPFAGLWRQLPVLLVALGFLEAMFIHARRTRSPEGALLAGGANVLAAVYLGVLTSFLILLRIDFGLPCAIAIILVTKSCDIGAYFTGRAIGRTKLIPWISPGKTREGLAGGVVFSALVAVGFQQLVLPASVLGGGRALPLCCPLGAAVLGAVLAMLGQAGDLLASMFKRDAGVKDSGNSLPGFGGVIDVLDSPIAIAPLAYAAMKVVGCC